MADCQNRLRTLLFLAERIGQAPYAVQREVIAAAETDDPIAWHPDRWRDFELSDTMLSRVLADDRERGLDERLKRMAERGIDALTYRDEAAVFGFETAHRLPPICFVRGDLRRLRRPGVAVVGTRKPTAYGRKLAGDIAAEAVVHGRAVISGAATGIDTAAHEGALCAGGLTVAVLGCGLFHTYPRQAGPLLDRIAETGAVVSQFAPEVPPDRKTFPIRNEIIAALADSVVVVEGAAKSGARYTADYARKLARRLFALPGEITRPQATLPNRLILEGATPLLHPADALGPANGAGAQTELGFGPPQTKRPARKALAPELDLERLSVLQRELLERIATGVEQADELLAAGLAAAPDLNQALLDLELIGAVRQEPGRRFRLIARLGDELTTQKGT